MSNFEVRYMGALVEHFETRGAADAWCQKRTANKDENWSRADLVVAPRRPVSLFCRGNLVDTFASEADATKRRDELVEESAARRGRGGLKAEHFEVVRGKAPAPQPEPAPGSPADLAARALPPPPPASETPTESPPSD